MAPPPPGSRQQQAYDELFRRPQPQPQPHPQHRPSPQPRPSGAHGAQYASTSQYSHPQQQQAQKLAPYPAPYAQFGQLPSSSSPQPPLPPGHAHHAAAPYGAYPQHQHPGGHAHPQQQQQHASTRAGQYLTHAAGTVPHRGHTIANPGGGQYATLPHDRNPYVASQSSTAPAAHASLSYSRSTGATPAAYPAAAASSYPQQPQPTGSSAPYSSAQAYQKQHAHPYPPSIPSSPAPSYHSQQSAANWSSGHYPHDHHEVHGGKLSLSPDLSRRPNSGSSTTGGGGGGLSARPGYAPTLSSGPPSASTSASLFSRTSTSSMSSLLPYASNNPDDHSAPSSSSGVSSLDVSPNPPTVPLPAPSQRPPSGASSMYSVGSVSSSNTGGSGGGRGGGAGGAAGASYGQPPRLPEINPTAHDDFFGDYYQPLPAGDGVTPTAANGDGTSYWTAKRMSSGGASIASVGARSVTPTISSAKQASKRYSPAMRAEDVEGYTPTAAYGALLPLRSWRQCFEGC